MAKKKTRKKKLRRMAEVQIGPVHRRALQVEVYDLTPEEVESLTLSDSDEEVPTEAEQPSESHAR